MRENVEREMKGDGTSDPHVDDLKIKVVCLKDGMRI